MQINHTNLLDLSTSSSKLKSETGSIRTEMKRKKREEKNIISFVKQRKMYYSIYLQYKYRSKIIIQTEIEQFYAKKYIQHNQR